MDCSDVTSRAHGGIEVQDAVSVITSQDHLDELRHIGNIHITIFNDVGILFIESARCRPNFKCDSEFHFSVGYPF